MNYQSRVSICLMLGLLMTLSSCVKDSDFGQEKPIEPNSVVTSNLLLTSFDASSFSDQSEQTERVFRTDTTYLELTSSNFLTDELSRTNLTFKFKNSLEKEFKIDIKFLNDLDELKFSLQIPVSAGTKQKPITVETNVIIKIPELVTFKEATKLVYNISMLPNDKKLSSENQGMLELQSDATYFLDF